MPAPYSPKAVANGFLQRAFDARQPTSQLKLQKLVFLAHGYHLAGTGIPLIDELFEAWDYGPVCRGLYQEFRDCGKEPITRLAMELDWATDTLLPVPAPKHDAYVAGVMDYVSGAYSDVSPFALSELSHKEGWAWDRARKRDKYGLRNVDIDNEMIRQDFVPFIRKKAA